MKSNEFDLYARRLGLAVLLTALGYAGLQLWGDPALLGDALPLLFGLALGALLAATLARRSVETTSSGFGLTFALPALLLLPAPGGLLVALAAAPGRAAAPIQVGVLALSFALASVFSDLWITLALAGSLAALAGFAILFIFVQALGAVLAMVIGLEPSSTEPRVRARWKSLLIDALSVPLGWMLASAISRQAWFESASIGALALGGGAIRLRLDRAVTELNQANRSLASRVTELATLHAIGREIVSSLDPNRVFSMIERECRKIFTVDYCMIALMTDDRELRSAYRRRRGETADSEEATLDPALAAWAGEEKRPQRIDDLQTAGGRELALCPLADDGVRSMMVVPLIVEDRAIGILSIQSCLPAAYDDHQLSVLTTIAQQAAVAIENARHYQRATLDSLTGFHSRDYFFRRLEEEHRRTARYGGSFSLLMIDLDGFKHLNDTYGHPAGDQYLRSIGETVRQLLREADLPCRYGGDEFCLLLPETDLEGGRAIAERIRDAVSSRIVEYDGRILRTTASIGIAAFPEHGTGPASSLLRNADQALYVAKHRGRDCVVLFAA